MPRKLTCLWLLCLPVLLWAAPPVSGQAAQGDLWLDLDQIDLANSRRLDEAIEQAGQRLIVTGLQYGAAAFPDAGELFPLMSRLRDRGDVLQDLLERVHRKGKVLYVFLDCLFWVRPGAPPEEDLLAKHLELAEKDHKGSCGLPAAGKYASPFELRVHEALRDLVARLAQKYPKLDGLVLRCSLATATLLGFSDAARVAYIRAKQLDPLDFATDSSSRELMVEWMTWRSEQVGRLVKEVSAAFKKHIPSGKVAAVGYANWYRLSLEARNASVDDWLTWAVRGWVDEVLLDCRWDKPENKDAYSFCTSLVGRTRKVVPLTPVLAFRQRHEVLNPQVAWEALRRQGAAGFVLHLGDVQDWAAMLSFLTQVRQAQAAPPRPAGGGPVDGAGKAAPPSLRQDPRLQARLTLDLKSPKVPALLAQLQKTTGVVMLPGPGIDLEKPAFGSISWRNLPAWQVMDRLAHSKPVEGHWEKTEDGYRLVGTVQRPSANPDAAAQSEEPSPPGPGEDGHPTSAAGGNLIRYLLGAIPILLILGVLLLRRRQSAPQVDPDTRRPHPKPPSRS